MKVWQRFYDTHLFHLQKQDCRVSLLRSRGSYDIRNNECQGQQWREATVIADINGLFNKFYSQVIVINPFFNAT